MKQVTFAVALIALGLAVGLAMPRVFAQAPQAEIQKWEQFCEISTMRGSAIRKNIEAGNASMASHGKNGYQLATVSTFGDSAVLLLCYRRPVR
jgi:hypothetical protein